MFNLSLNNYYFIISRLLLLFRIIDEWLCVIRNFDLIIINNLIIIDIILNNFILVVITR